MRQIFYSVNFIFSICINKYKISLILHSIDDSSILLFYYHTRELLGKKIRIPCPFHARVYFPHMCNIKTDAMNNKLITNTGTGPLRKQLREKNKRSCHLDHGSYFFKKTFIDEKGYAEF